MKETPFQFAFCRECGKTSTDLDPWEHGGCSGCDSDAPLATFDRTWPPLTDLEEFQIASDLPLRIEH